MLLIWIFQKLPTATQPTSSVLITLRYAFHGLGCVTMNQNVLMALMSQKNCVKTQENVEACSHPPMVFWPHHPTQWITQTIKNVSTHYLGPLTWFSTWHLWCLIFTIGIILISLKLEMVAQTTRSSLANSHTKPMSPHLSKPLGIRCGWGEKKTDKTKVERVLSKSFRFVSNFMENGLGFLLQYDAYNCGSKVNEGCNRGRFTRDKERLRVQIKHFLWLIAVECGGHFTNASDILTSPLYPNQYPLLADCTYTISQPEGTYIILSVISMDISCHAAGSDNIELRDGNSTTSPLMGKWCGNGSNFPNTLQTTQNHLRIRLI